MLQGREEFENYFVSQLAKINSKEKIKAIVLEALTVYKLSALRANQIINLSVLPREMTEAEMYWILMSMKKCGYDIDIKSWYTEAEIAIYKKGKPPKDPVFPFVKKMIQVSDDTYVGKIGMRELIELRNAGYINYNFNTQRRAQQILRGGKEFNVPFINNSAVAQIQECMERREFISNTITLNLSVDTNFSYDEETFDFVIPTETVFDIIDGYHRTIAGNNLCEKDSDFDYPMEIRITFFPEYKAQTFIWQEEQKTHMPKTVVQSYNANDTANRIAKRIAEDPRCNFQGLISQTGVVEFSFLSDAIREVFTKGKSKSEERSLLVTVPGKVIAGLNQVSEIKSELLEKGFSKNKLLLLCCLINIGKVDMYFDIEGRVKHGKTTATAMYKVINDVH